MSIEHFLLFIPKVRVLLSGEFGDLLPEQKANEMAAGYHHTYFQTDDIELKTLVVWPSDEKLEQASTLALSEASDLLAVLGVDAAAVMETSSDRTLNRRALTCVPGTRIEHVLIITETTDNSDVSPTKTCPVPINEIEPIIGGFRRRSC